MKIYNTQTYNYQTQNNKQYQPSFNAKIRFINPETKLLHNIDKSDLDSGLWGLLTGKPFKSLIEKFTKMHPEHIVEFSYEQPIFYGFNYVKGNGMAQSCAKLYAKNVETNKLTYIKLDEDTRHPFYELTSRLVEIKDFWTK